MIIAFIKNPPQSPTRRVANEQCKFSVSSILIKELMPDYVKDGAHGATFGEHSGTQCLFGHVQMITQNALQELQQSILAIKSRPS